MGKLTVRVQIGSDQPVVFNEKTMSGPNEVYRGRNTPTRASRTQARIGREISGMLMDEAVLKEQRTFANEMKVMIKAIKVEGEREANRMIDFITRSMMRLDQGDSGVDFSERYLNQGSPMGTNRVWQNAKPPVGSFEWAPLNQSWIRTKRQSRYFEHKGQLLREIRGMRRSYPQSLGGVQVAVREMSDLARRRQKRKFVYQEMQSRRTILANLEVQILPRAGAHHFPGLATGRWDTIDRRAAFELSGAFSQEAGEKLANLHKPKNKAGRKRVNPKRFRPMFGPVTQYWIMHRIPRAIGAAINRGTKLRQRY
jgi:hypothetical protein